MPIQSSFYSLLKRDDEFRLVLEYIGDKKTLSSLFLSTKDMQKAVIDAHIIRLKCFCLPVIAFQIDQNVRLFYQDNRERFVILNSHNSQNQIEQSDRTQLEVASIELNSIIQHEADVKRGPFVDRRITPEFIKKYLYCSETVHEALLPEIFMILKEDIIDALSEHPDELLDTIHIPSYPSELRTCDPRYVNQKAIFDVNSFSSAAKKRETGDLCLKLSHLKRRSLCHSQDEQDIGEFFVSTQITSTRKSDWHKFGVPDRMQKYMPVVSEFFPASLFAGKKEGDILEFSLEESTIRLRLVQLLYRYGYCGSFEKVYSLLMQNIESNPHCEEIDSTDLTYLKENLKFYTPTPLNIFFGLSSRLQRSFIENIEI